MALVNSLLSEPNKTLVASGYSILMDDAYLSGHNQLIIPGINKFLESEILRMRIQSIKTKFMFTWGEDERGLYSREFKLRSTKEYFGEMSNVEFIYHSRGHVYDVKSTIEFCSF